MQEDIKIQKSNGFGKNGQLNYFIRPVADCMNRSRKASGFNYPIEKIDNLIRKWYYPKVILYNINGMIIGSNSKENALKEFWRVCEKDIIGIPLPVKLFNP